MLALLAAHKSSWLLKTTKSFPDTLEVWILLLLLHSISKIQHQRDFGSLETLSSSSATPEPGVGDCMRCLILSLEITGLYHMCLPRSYSSLFIFLCIVLCTELCPSTGVWTLLCQIALYIESRFLISIVAQSEEWNAGSYTSKPQVNTGRILLPFKCYK